MKCNYPIWSPVCSFHYNGECLRDHNYECPALVTPTEKQNARGEKKMDNDFPTTDWLTKGIPENQLLKEKIEALEDVIRFFNKWHPYPKEKPAGRMERHLVCKLPPGSNSSPWIDIAYWGKSEQCEWADSSLKRKKGYWIQSDSEWGDYAIDNVYAWMPLPEPYAPKEKTDDK